jgi:hypothetical protein
MDSGLGPVADYNESSDFVQGGESADCHHLAGGSLRGVPFPLYSANLRNLVEAGYREVPWFH